MAGNRKESKVENKTNAERFIVAYNKIDYSLRTIYGFKRWKIPFSSRQDDQIGHFAITEERHLISGIFYQKSVYLSMR